MSFTCFAQGESNPHTHELVSSARACANLAAAVDRAREFAPVEDGVTDRQLNYIVSLNGDKTYAQTLSKKKASEYIKSLMRTPVAARLNDVAKGLPYSASEPSPEERARAIIAAKPRPEYVPRPQLKDDKRLPMVAAMLAEIPDGYYAVEAHEGAHTTFMRLSRTKARAKNWGGCIKVQSQHGPRLEVEAALWPSGTWTIYRSQTIDQMMMLAADHQGSARRYARKIGKCCRCNAPLTDVRSRHYGIGPECEQHWPWMLELVDLEDAEAAQV